MSALEDGIGDVEAAIATAEAAAPPAAAAASAPREERGRMRAADRGATLAQIVAAHAGAAAVFRRYDLDFCCRGDATVVEACRERRVRAERVFADLDRAVAAAPQQAGGSGPRAGSFVPDVERHHASERRALPYIASLLPKIAARHGHRNRQLDLLCDAGQDLVETLEAYMDEDERRLLPAVAAGGCEVVRGELDRHNCELEVLLAHIRSLADGYVAPEWGDQPYRALMEELEALERDVKERVRLEERGLVQQTGPGDAGPAGARAPRPRARARCVPDDGE